MPKRSLSPNKETIEELEQRTSPSHSEPDERSSAQELRRHKFSEGGELATGLAGKLEEVQKIPIMPGARIVKLVTEFSDFPWAQDTVMAAHQLEEVLILFLYRYLELRPAILHQ